MMVEGRRMQKFTTPKLMKLLCDDEISELARPSNYT